ncbi:GNAT family N-acetyltransferase [Phreatobacter cathodiphilus]|uniref:GNAT family N-acetyltransferase n=1 Tax=Phreatobacter cathodiphilus TaxID=1868589 RepID=A0A2S0NC49_9HYPH|nr:GNAT family N-acetyltransferase [Phreatobacter cathodiphilus]AVO45617.1 GNAT family N-acetyltransferase [Phreatobacter cathodiphilus]
MTGEPTIRLAGPDDHEAIAAMNRAMDLFYNPQLPPSAAGDVTALMRRIEADPQLGTLVALAFNEGQPVGIAFFVLVHPGRRLGGMLFVKDLFVVEAARGAGIGEALMAFLAGFARDKGITRIDLTAEPHNEGAQRFYERLGMKVRPAISYRLEGEGLDALARGDGKRTPHP